jgi:hypothetical protein
MDRLGEFFTLAEMTRTSTGLENVPGPAVRANLQELVATVLDPLRRHLGRPVRITSGFRSKQVNRRVGGSPHSRHLDGEAADIKVDGLDAHDLVEAIQLAELDFDQVIAYAPERGGHVHLGILAGAAARHRRQLLWAPAGTLSYVPYTAGVRP